MRIGALLLAGAALTAGTGIGAPLAGQEEPPSDTAAVGAAAPAAGVQDTLEARPPRPAPLPRFAVSMALRTLGLGELQTQPVLARWVDLAGNVQGTTVLSRTVEASGGVGAGLDLVYRLDPTWGLRLGVAAGVAELTTDEIYDVLATEEGQDRALAKLDERDGFVAGANALAETEAADLRTWSLEGALRYRIPSTRRLRPYLELGLEFAGWESDEGLAAIGLAESGGRVAATAAVGSVLSLTERISARFQATTVAFRTPLSLVPVDEEGARSSSLALVFQAPAVTGFADPARELATALRLEVGVTAGFGGIRAAPAPEPPAPPEGAGSSSPPDR